MSTVDVRNLTRRTAPRFAYQAIAAKVLPGWELSLAYLTDAKAQEANYTLRKKSYVPNVLSYETGTKSGEITICLAEAKRQAPSYFMEYDEFVAYLFIHGCLHLKGYPHGPTMDKMERVLLARFSALSSPTNAPKTNSNRHRHRHAPDKGRRR